MSINLQKRAYKYRFYPTEKQVELLAKTFGCTRLVYNKMLAYKQEQWKTHQESVSYNQSSKLLTEWKKTPELAFLGEVASVSLQQSLRHLDQGYRNFFAKRAGFPTFKKRSSFQKASFTRSGFTYQEQQLKLAKMTTPLEIVWSRPLPEGAKPSSVVVSRTSSNEYYISILIEEAIEELPAVGTSVGLDLGVTTTITTSDGEFLSLPKLSKRDRRRMKTRQRELARRQKGSKNYGKTRVKLAREQQRLVNRKKDYLHKVSSRLINENQVICLEDLSIKQMTRSSKGRRKAGLNRAILENSWGELKAQLLYKAQWYGREVVLIDKYYPSTRKCSACDELTGPSGIKDLSIRQWACSSCLTTHDRDLNAAQNILTAGLAGLAYGEDVRRSKVNTTYFAASMK